jgi:CHAT domain-containing protein
MKHFEKSVAIAREVGDKRDEGIALMNRALLNRIGGNLNDARNDYRAAGTLFEEIGYQRGRAGVLMGIARIAELEDRDLATALKGYQDALDIYTALELPFAQAEALVRIGDVLKRTLTPGRTTRDLVFDDEPTMPQIDKADALKQCRDAFARALTLADALNAKELQWSALQGLGFVFTREGKLENALAQYQKAVDIVATMRISMESAELLGEFMAGKEDLFEEAMSLCGQLYEKSKDQKYLSLQMQYSETLRNEVQKASAALVQFNFDDTKKQADYAKIMEMGRQLAKAQSAIPVSAVIPADSKKLSSVTPEQKAEFAEAKTEADRQKITVQKLDKEYSVHLAAWKKQHPEDAIIFDSSSRVDIPLVQKALKDDQIALQYISLTDKLLIISISREKIDCVDVNIGKKDLDDIIKKELLVNHIENRVNEYDNPEKFKQNFAYGIKIMHKLYSLLIHPIETLMENKNRIYIISDGFLAQVPFNAMVVNEDVDNPVFLISKYEIAYTRPTFISALVTPKVKKPMRTLLAVANPRNEIIISMASLQGATDEVRKSKNFISEIAHTDNINIQEKKDATDKWLIENLKNNSYDIIYFATHGMPYSEIYTQYFIYGKKLRNSIPGKILDDPKSYPEYQDKLEEDLLKMMDREIQYIGEKLPSVSPLNGYLYMSIDKNDSNSTGLLTIKKIWELSGNGGKNLFENTRLVLLSACNTAVTFAPKSLKNDKTELAIANAESEAQAKNIEKSLRSVGWIPGQDQVSFVDIFMHRGINNVFGTLWQADDAASSFLMPHFILELVNQSKQKRTEDAVAAYTLAQRDYIESCWKGNDNLSKNDLIPARWAPGAIFGK